MTDTAIFSFARATDDVVNIGTVILDGEPWFFGTDVLQALNIAKGSTTDTYARISEDRKRYAGRTSLGLPGGRPAVLLNEAGLYDCVIRSDKPEARLFQSWVTGEVLPSIRKTGKYALADHGREPMPLLMDIAEAQSWFRKRSVLGSVIRADIYKREASEIPPWGSHSVILEVPAELRRHVLYLFTRLICRRRVALGEARLPSWPGSAAVPDG